MKRRLLFILTALLGFLPDLLWAQSQKEKPAYQIRVDEVSLDVEVLDAQGNPVFGLQQQDFQVKENGRIMSLTHFSELHDRPVSIAFVLDRSSISREQFSRAKQFLFRLAHILDREDEICLYTFDDKDAYLELDFTKDRIPFLEALRNLDVTNTRTGRILRELMGATPKTGLGIDMALYRLRRGSNSKRAVLLLSNRFKGLGPATVEHVEESGYTLLTLSFNNKLNWIVTLGGDQMSKDRMMSQSGGRKFSAHEEDITGVCREIASSLKNHYSLAYSTEVGTGRQKKRKVEVRLPGHSYTIHSRRAFVPPPE